MIIMKMKNWILIMKNNSNNENNNVCINMK